MKVKDKTYEKLLDWSTVNARLAWNVLLLMGGGFALADGCEVRTQTGNRPRLFHFLVETIEKKNNHKIFCETEECD